MKRRHAIKQIVVISAGVALLPSCGTDAVMPVFKNIPLDKGQYKFLDQFTEALLPKGNTRVAMPETAADFILTVFNDCRSPEDIQRYMAGMNEFMAYLKEKYNADFGKISPTVKADLFTYLSGEAGPSDVMKYFYGNSRDLAIEHFTTSEFFMKNVLDWEFAPGRFAGCAAA